MSLAEHKYSYVAHPVDVMEAFVSKPRVDL